MANSKAQKTCNSRTQTVKYFDSPDLFSNCANENYPNLFISEGSEEPLPGTKVLAVLIPIQARNIMSFFWTNSM